MRIVLQFAVAAIAVTAFTSGVRADDRQVCFSVGSDAYKKDDVIDTGMRACTRMIQSGQYAGKNLAYVYRGRGYWKDRKGDYDAALEDFNEAIRLDPSHVEGYDYRSSVWKNKGNLERAIADLDMSIRLDPTYAAAYYRRGEIYRLKGEIEKARADYNAALTLPTKDRIAQWAQDSAREQLANLSGSSTPRQSEKSEGSQGSSQSWGCKAIDSDGGTIRTWGYADKDKARSVALDLCNDKRGCKIAECRTNVANKEQAYSIWPGNSRNQTRCVGSGCD
jgi:tetratricopeptide (TPR) repeat protein